MDHNIQRNRIVKLNLRPNATTKHLVVSGGLELLRIFKAHLKLELSNFPHARAEHAGVPWCASPVLATKDWDFTCKLLYVILSGGLEHFFYFPIILGMEKSSQLTNSLHHFSG